MSATNEKTRILARDSTFEKDDSGIGQVLLTALANFIVPFMHGNTKAQKGSYTAGGPITVDSASFANATAFAKSVSTTEGQNLLNALKLFAESLGNSPNSLHKNQKVAKKTDQDHQHADIALHHILRLPSHPTTDVMGEGWYDVNEVWNNADDAVQENISGNIWPIEGRNMHLSESPSDFGFFMTVGAEANTRRQQWIEKKINEVRNMVFNDMPIRLLKFNKGGKEITLVERPQIMEYIFAEINSNVTVQSMQNYNWQDASQFEQYAILSHTWFAEGEITYSDWTNPTMLLDKTSLGYKKLANFCTVAAEHGMRLAWMDTVCINKESSTELDESIRSMFKWYENANICIVYLAETSSLKYMKKDKWFTRGWTLQELLAPHQIKFYARNWRPLKPDTSANHSTHLATGSEKLSVDLVSKICEATGLEEKELLNSPDNLHSVPIWCRMQWAAHRKVTRAEDTAYSLMGIFNVSMPTGYGEGANHAFTRLVKEILNSKLTSMSKLEIINWGLGHWTENIQGDSFSNSVSSGLLIPRGPDAYKQSNGNIHFCPTFSPITLTYMGLCVPVLLMPSHSHDTNWGFFNKSVTPKGDYSAIFYKEDSISRNNLYKILDTSKGLLFTSTFGVLNIAEEATHVTLPDNHCCLAVHFSHWPLGSWEIPEHIALNVQDAPVTFNIDHHNNSSVLIPKDELIRHGMTLRMMYL